MAIGNIFALGRKLRGEEPLFYEKGGKPNTTLIKYDLPDTAADTISLENTALKANHETSVSVDCQGYINSMTCKSLHLESTGTVFKSKDGVEINLSLDDCLISDALNTFDWGARGYVYCKNTRWTNGAGAYLNKQVFKKFNAVFNVENEFIVDTSSYGTEILSGAGVFRRGRVVPTRRGGRFQVRHSDDNRMFWHPTASSIEVSLPDTTLVKSGFRIAAVVRAGEIKIYCKPNDTIIGIQNATKGGGMTGNVTGSYVELVCQNDDGGQPYWVITTLKGSWNSW